MLTVHRAVAPATQASPAPARSPARRWTARRGMESQCAAALALREDDDRRLRAADETLRPDPESVLRAFCYAAPAGAEVEPVGLSSAIPPQPAVRWGVFRVRGDAGFVQRAIVIRHDPRTLQWTTGNGRANVFNASTKRGLRYSRMWRSSPQARGIPADRPDSFCSRRYSEGEVVTRRGRPRRVRLCRRTTARARRRSPPRG